MKNPNPIRLNESTDTIPSKILVASPLYSKFETVPEGYSEIIQDKVCVYCSLWS